MEGGGATLAPSCSFSSQTWFLAAEGVAESEGKTGANTVVAASQEKQKENFWGESEGAGMMRCTPDRAVLSGPEELVYHHSRDDPTNPARLCYF